MSQDKVRLAGVWFYGTLVYCLVVAVVAGLGATHHSGGDPMPPLVRVFFALALGCYLLFSGLRFESP